MRISLGVHPYVYTEFVEVQSIWIYAPAGTSRWAGNEAGGDWVEDLGGIFELGYDDVRRKEGISILTCITPRPFIITHRNPLGKCNDPRSQGNDLAFDHAKDFWKRSNNQSITRSSVTQWSLTGNQE